MVSTCDFQSAQGQSLNAYTDSRYAFHILSSCHLEGSWTTYNKRRIHNSEQIMAALKDSYVPTAIGIVPCESHQNGNSIVSKGNKGANEVAKVVTLRGADPSLPQQGIPPLQPTSPLSSPDPGIRQILSYLHQLFHPNSQLCLTSPRPTYSLPLRIYIS